MRGRIRINEQIRRRFGIPVPVEVRYDELACQVRASHREAEAKRRDMAFDRLRGEIAAAFSDKSMRRGKVLGTPGIRDSFVVFFVEKRKANARFVESVTF